MNELHQRLLDIAVATHKALKNEVDYTLTAGSAIGAVRHKGFIPWDDDMDLMIMHRDADKFIETLEKNLPKRYKVISNNKKFPYKFLRVIDTETKLVGFEEGGYGLNANIKDPRLWIDIFTVGEAKKKKRPFWAAFWTGLYYVRSGRHESRLVTPFMRILKIVPFKLVKHMIDKIMDKQGGDFQYYDYPHDRFAWRKVDLSKKKLVTFENKKLYLADDIRLYLEDHYGDYMKMPPMDEHWTHDVEIRK